MKKLIQFGEYVEGYDIPVLNEREIRAAAGIIFFYMFIALMQIMYEGNFVMIKYGRDPVYDRYVDSCFHQSAIFAHAHRWSADCQKSKNQSMLVQNKRNLHG